VKTVRTKTQRLSYQAVMVALSVVLTRVAGFRLAIGGIEGVRLGLGPLPLIMSGVLWGPAAGFFVGIVADIVGHVLSPMGSYMPLITITTGLAGALPALMLRYNGYYKHPGIGKLAGAIFGGQFITHMILVPYVLQILFGMLWRPLFVPRLVAFLIHVPTYSFLTHYLLYRTPIFAQLVRER
jgi:ECF transporter S component (folate family)